MKENKKHSEDFLRSKVGKSTGFSIPENYLSDFDIELNAKILKSEFGNNNPYEVPRDYFTTIDDKILKKVAPKVVSFSFRKKVVQLIPYAAAASILLFIGLNTFVFSNKTSLDTLTEVDLEYWLENNEISTLDIADVLKSEILNENDFTLASIEDASIEDFIEDYDNYNLLNE